MENASQVGETRSRLAAETAEKAQLITALLPAAQDAASYDLLVSNIVLISFNKAIFLSWFTNVILLLSHFF